MLHILSEDYMSFRQILK